MKVVPIGLLNLVEDTPVKNIDTSKIDISNIDPAFCEYMKAMGMHDQRCESTGVSEGDITPDDWDTSEERTKMPQTVVTPVQE